jgi:osmotically-inducible protein OsmY
MLRTVTFPARATYGVGRVSARAGYAAGRRSARTAYRATRLLGLRRMFVFGTGVAVGLLWAPTTGAEMREKLRRAWEERRGPTTDIDLADRVRHELAQSPRTWHLPQPDVAVVEGRVVLSGSAPHSSGKTDLERTAAAVAGVVEVDSQLTVGGTANGGS